MDNFQQLKTSSAHLLNSFNDTDFTGEQLYFTDKKKAGLWHVVHIVVPRETCGPSPSCSPPPWLPSLPRLPPDDLHPMLLIHIRAKDRGSVSGLDEEAAAEESKGGQHDDHRARRNGGTNRAAAGTNRAAAGTSRAAAHEGRSKSLSLHPSGGSKEPHRSSQH